MSSSSASQDQQKGHDEQAPAVLSNKLLQVKKQTRRRTHTSRPYQERLLNMAEARREIVTALRIHRANMRQQSNKYHQQQPRLQQQQQLLKRQVMFQEQSQQAFGGGPPAVAMSYACSSLSSNNHLRGSFPFASLIAGAASAGNYNSSPSMFSYDLTPIEEEAPAAALIGGLEQWSCSLPAQPLGLNLSFQGFGSSLNNGNNSDNDPFGVPPIQPSSCPATSSYLLSPVTAMAELGSTALEATEENKCSSADAPVALRKLLDSDGGGEVQSMGLSETAASVAAASAWWTKILESGGCGVGESAGAPQTTTGAAGEVGVVDDAACSTSPEWQWLCDGVGVEKVVTAGSKSDVLETTMRVDDRDYSGRYEGENISLPCTGIGEWNDGDWFS